MLAVSFEINMGDFFLRGLLSVLLSYGWIVAAFAGVCLLNARKAVRRDARGGWRFLRLSLLFWGAFLITGGAIWFGTLALAARL